MDKFIDVCGIPYKYEEFDSSDRTDNSIGRSDPKMALIRICKDCSEETKQSTIIHEWLHAILDCHGLQNHANDEILVSTLETELYRNGFRIQFK